MNTRALVLGGGGVTGVAWELGILSGLAELSSTASSNGSPAGVGRTGVDRAGVDRAGVDLTGADVVVGTSAGSVVAAQIAATTGPDGPDLEELYQRQLASPDNEIAARMPPLLLARYAWAVLRSRDGRAAGARIGRLALAARTVPEAERRKVIAGRLPVHEWPDRRVLITPPAAPHPQAGPGGAGRAVADPRRRRAHRRVRRVRPRRRRTAGRRGRSQLRGTRRVAAGVDQRAPVHRRRHPLRHEPRPGRWL